MFQQSKLKNKYMDFSLNAMPPPPPPPTHSLTYTWSKVFFTILC